MKVLIFLALAALVAAEAEPEADPQFLLNTGFPIAPIMSIKSEDAKPITYTIPSAYPYAAWPYAHNHYNTWQYLLPQVGKPAEGARAKREAEAEADPQFFMNPLTYSFPTASPLTYNAGAWPAAWGGAWPANWAGAWPANWAGAWPHSGLPIAYTLAKKTE